MSQDIFVSREWTGTLSKVTLRELRGGRNPDLRRREVFSSTIRISDLEKPRASSSLMTARARGRGVARPRPDLVETLRATLRFGPGASFLPDADSNEEKSLLTALS